MGLLYNGLTPISLFALLGLMGALLLLNEVARRSKSLSIALFCVLPVILAVGVLAGWIGSPTGRTWFGWVKVVSALAGVYGFLLIRHTKLGEKKFAAIFPVSILAINIAEAVVREFQVFATFKAIAVDASGVTVLGGGWNILNAIAGILCILTLTGFSGIRVSKDKSRDMVWPDMTWMYIIGYTIWNFAYVYGCISTRSMYAGFGILAIALIAEFFFKRGVWLQHRAQILSLYAMFSLSVDFQANAAFQILPSYRPEVLWALGAVSLAFNTAVFAFMVYTVLTKRKNPLADEVFGHTEAYRKNVIANCL